MGAGENARPHKMVGLENCSDLDLLHQEGLYNIALLDILELLEGDAAFPHGMSHPAGTPLI